MHAAQGSVGERDAESAAAALQLRLAQARAASRDAEAKAWRLAERAYAVERAEQLRQWVEAGAGRDIGAVKDGADALFKQLRARVKTGRPLSQVEAFQLLYEATRRHHPDLDYAQGGPGFGLFDSQVAGGIQLAEKPVDGRGFVLKIPPVPARPGRQPCRSAGTPC